MFLHNRIPKTEDVLEPLAGKVPRMLLDDCAWFQGLQQDPELPLSTLPDYDVYSFVLNIY